MTTVVPKRVALPGTTPRQAIAVVRRGRTMGGRGQRPTGRVWAPAPLTSLEVRSGEGFDASGDRVLLGRSSSGCHTLSASPPVAAGGAQ